MESSPLTELVKSLAGLHQTWHKALKEQCLEALKQAQAEYRQIIKSMV